MVLIGEEVVFPEGTTILHIETVREDHEPPHKGGHPWTTVSLWFLVARELDDIHTVRELYVFDVDAISGEEYRDLPEVHTGLWLVATTRAHGFLDKLSDMEWILLSSAPHGGA